MEDFVLHGQFDRVGELESVAAEELDAVVSPRIVRGRDDHAGLKSMCPCQEGDGRSGDDARAFDAGSGLAQTGSECGGDPRAGLARIPAEDDFGLCSRLAQGVTQRQATGEDRVCIERKFSRDGANAVGTEERACVGCGHSLTS